MQAIKIIMLILCRDKNTNQDQGEKDNGHGHSLSARCLIAVVVAVEETPTELNNFISNYKKLNYSFNKLLQFHILLY